MKVKHSVSLHLVSAYLPAAKKKYYFDTLSEWQIRLKFYSSPDKVIVAGDLNAQVSWPSSNAAISGSIYKSRMLSEMVHKYHLVPLELMSLCTGPRYSFIPTKAMIDHNRIGRSHENRIVNDGEWVLKSDHYSCDHRSKGSNSDRNRFRYRKLTA